LRPQWGAFGRAPATLAVNFVNPLAIESGLAARLGLSRRLIASHGTRKLTKRDMLHNDACPAISVNPQTFDVLIDGQVIRCDPAREVPLSRRYMLR
jgi:urease subunit alpha